MEYKNVICPVDGSDLGDKALEDAVYISKVSNARLLVVHVVEKWYKAGDVATHSSEWETIHEGWVGEGKVLLNKTKDKLEKTGFKNYEMVLREGDAAYEIVGVAIERNADLIVMASHRYSPLGKVFYGSVIDKVTKKAPCPVLWVFR